jgi:dethiobiotin synthetase
MQRGFFITGTDTGIGKTVCTLALMRHFQQKNLKVVAMKPIASGCEETPHGLRNEDALFLNQQSSLKIPYEWTNQYSFLEPIAPHLAVELKGEKIRLGKVAFYYEKLCEKAATKLRWAMGRYVAPKISDFIFKKANGEEAKLEIVQSDLVYLNADALYAEILKEGAL